jgi:hypothetical protein
LLIVERHPGAGEVIAVMRTVAGKHQKLTLAALEQIEPALSQTL